MEGETIIFESQCQTCIDHKTDLGVLKQLEQTVKDNFGTWTTDAQNQLTVSWFEQYKTDERMKYIERSKNKTTEKIQGYKQKNIASLNGGGK